MTIAELRALAQWHDERATHAEKNRAGQQQAFHRAASAGLRELIRAFETLSLVMVNPASKP